MKKQVSLRIDPDILAWFKRQGPGYRKRINRALRAFVEAQNVAARGLRWLGDQSIVEKQRE